MDAVYMNVLCWIANTQWSVHVQALLCIVDQNTGMLQYLYECYVKNMIKIRKNLII